MDVRTRSIIAGSTLALLVLPAALNAQNAKAASRSLSEDQEIRMARSAAAPQVSDNASVWVLRPGGHVEVVEGTNGVNCFVDRDANPEALYPICYDVEASRTILPIAIMRTRLRLAGNSVAEIERSIDDAIARGELHLPTRLAIAWMQSAHQLIYAGEQRVGTWFPHVMLYEPNVEPATLGFPTANPPGVFIQNPGEPMAHLIVVTPLWSNGKPGPALPAAQGSL